MDKKKNPDKWEYPSMKLFQHRVKMHKSSLMLLYFSKGSLLLIQFSFLPTWKYTLKTIRK